MTADRPTTEPRTANPEAVRRIVAHLWGEDIVNLRAAVESFANGWTVVDKAEAAQGAAPRAEGLDWTRDAEGYSNSSPLFVSLVEEVARLIRQEAHFLLQGDTESAARLIMAQLAHKHGLAPSRPSDERVPEEER